MAARELIAQVQWGTCPECTQQRRLDTRKGRQSVMASHRCYIHREMLPCLGSGKPPVEGSAETEMVYSEIEPEPCPVPRPEYTPAPLSAYLNGVI